MLVRISTAGTVGTSNSGSATGGTANRRGVQAKAPLLTSFDRVAWLWCLLPLSTCWIHSITNYTCRFKPTDFLCSDLFFGI
jgi:hypothetical protein